MFTSDETSDRYVKIGSGESQRLAVIDYLKAIKDFPRIADQAWLDIANRYRRSLLGPLWMVFGLIAISAGFGVVGMRFFEMDMQFYMLYVMAGIFIWQFISSCLSEATSIYAMDSNMILSGRPSLSGYAVRVVIRQLYVMAHGLPFLAILCIASDRFVTETLLFIPGLLVVSLALLPWTLVIALAATRMRDFGQLIQVLLQFVVYLTPVFWTEKVLKVDSQLTFFLHINPFYHMLKLVRDPLIGGVAESLNWTTTIGVGLLGYALAAVVFPVMRRKVAYWL